MIFRAVLSATMYGQVVQNVIHFDKGDATWPADGNLLCTTLRDSFIGGTNGIKVRVNQCLVWNLITVYDAEHPGNAPVNLAVNIAGSGTGSSGNQVPIWSYILQIRSVVGGKHGKGRIYLAGTTLSEFANGVLNSTAITNWGLTITQLTGNFITGGGSTGFKIGIAPRATPADFLGADYLQISSKAGCQRRRNIGVGI